MPELQRDFLAEITLDKLKQLPYLTKDELRKFGKTTLLSNKEREGNIFIYKWFYRYSYLHFIMEEHSIKNGLEYIEARVKNWAGVNRTMARGMIGGRRILPESELKPPLLSI